jgi:hypothetical protein
MMTNRKNRIIEKYKPKIWDRVVIATRQCKKGLLEMSQGSLMGMLLACTLLPLAVGGTGSAIVIISSILSGIGGNLIANWAQRFYDMENKSDQNERGKLIYELENTPELRQAVKELLIEFDVIEALLNSTDDISREQLLKIFEGSLLQEVIGDDNIQVSSRIIANTQTIKGSRNIQAVGDGITIESESVNVRITKSNTQE